MATKNKTAAKHTPGPWRFQLGSITDWFKDGQVKSWSRPGVYGGSRLQVEIHADPFCMELANADARLIAAAPDLLEAAKLQEGADRAAGLALKDSSLQGWAIGLGVHAAEKRRAAIAKADGVAQ